MQCETSTIHPHGHQTHQSTAKSQKPCRKRKAVQSLASPFIVATNKDTIKPDATSRTLIRHHVMKGKNRKAVSSQRTLLRSWVNQERGFPLSQQTAAKWLRGDCLANPLRLQINDPGLPITGLKFNIEPCMVQVIHNFISIMTRAMYPTQCCINSVKEENDWFEDLSRDATYSQVVLHTAQTYFDTVKSGIYGPNAMRHMNRAMLVLRKKLLHGNEAISDSTIFAITTIAMASEIFGDLESAKKHLNGLYQVLHVRGGIITLAHSRLLQFKCFRLDLRISLKSRSIPLFFTSDNISWNTYLTGSNKSSTTPIHTTCKTPDFRLENVWLDLREFVKAINLAHQTGRNISTELFQEALISLQYRLQCLTYNIQDLQETVRLSMLALSTSIFLEKDGIELRCTALAEELRTALQLVQYSANTDYLKLTLWLLVIGRVSVLDSPEDSCWLKAKLSTTSQALGLLSWKEARLVLKTFIWMDAMHDEPGKIIFDDAIRSKINQV